MPAPLQKKVEDENYSLFSPRPTNDYLMSILSTYISLILYLRFNTCPLQQSLFCVLFAATHCLQTQEAGRANAKSEQILEGRIRNPGILALLGFWFLVWL
jgi:hypothetical protein